MSELSALIKKLNKDFGEDRISYGTIEPDIPRIPFSSPRVNYMLYGGIPMNRITELAGIESSGKSTTALDLIKNYQKMETGKEVVWIDVEGTFDNAWATTLGVNVDKVIIFNPKAMCAEDVFECIEKMVSTGDVGFCVLDSIPALVPGQVFEQDYDKQEMGGIAKSLTRFLRSIHPKLLANSCTLILLNQVRDKIGGYAGGLTTPGGHALRHYCSVRLMLSQGILFDDNGKDVSKNAENPAGHTVDIKIIKTKICPPNRKNGCYTLNYLTGVDYISDAIDCAISMGYIQASGAWYKLCNLDTGELTEDKIQGRANVINYFKENNEQFEKLYNKVNEEMSK